MLELEELYSEQVGEESVCLVVARTQASALDQQLGVPSPPPLKKRFCGLEIYVCARVQRRLVARVGALSAEEGSILGVNHEP